MHATKVIYKILERLEKAMDEERFDIKEISSDVFEISEIKWLRIMEIMVDKHFITGLNIHRSSDGISTVSISDPRITFEGLEYLVDNSNQTKIINAAKTLKDVVPFV